MNCVLHLKLHRPLPRDAHPLPIPFHLPPPPPSPSLQSLISPTPSPISAPKSFPPIPMSKNTKLEAAPQEESPSDGDLLLRWALLGGASLVLALVLMGADPGRKAMALGPEGPLMEEFWDNVRRYVLYALTVSTGAVYTVSKPIIDLLKNPVTAVIVVVVAAGTVYLLSQVLSAMVGISEFSYDYAY